MKALGGIAPFGYRWQHGLLIIDEHEAPVRKLIFELFLQHRRKKTVAKILNDLGYRTRNASFFSDTTIDRLLRDTTAKGSRNINGKEIVVEPIVSHDIWERVNQLLNGPKQSKRSSELFSGRAYCGCGSKMIVPSNTPKYICVDCRHKILKDDLEAIFVSRLKTLGEEELNDLYDNWELLTQKEKRIVIEQLCERIVIGRDTITIQIGFGSSPHPIKAMTDGQQISRGNETLEKDNFITELTLINDPLLSETDAAAFLGVSKMTLLRKRNARDIGYFRIGQRILYSKQKHLLPFLKSREM